MPTAPGFWTALAATVLLLGAAFVTGRGRRRRLHLVVGPLAMVVLAVAIVLTEQLMRNYTFAADDLRFHLRFAKAAGLLAVPVMLSGLWLWRRPAARRWHRLAVYVFLLATVLATATGIWLMTRATPK